MFRKPLCPSKPFHKLALHLSSCAAAADFYSGALQIQNSGLQAQIPVFSSQKMLFGGFEPPWPSCYQSDAGVEQGNKSAVRVL